MTENAEPGLRKSSEIVQVIEPPRRWAWVDWRELWRYRELFGFLVWRDVKVKYKQTFLGAGWAILVPFMQMVVLSFVGSIAKLPSNGLPGPIFYYAGLLPWTYFANSLGMSSQSMVQSGHILTKVYFPRLIVPTAPCIAGLVDFGIACVILVVMMIVYGITPAASAVLLPLLILIAFGTAAGAGFFLSALNVKYRDVRYIVPFVIQMWMWCTVFVPFSAVEEHLGKYKYLYGLNPMAGVVEGFRWCLAHHRMTRMVDGRVLPVDPPWMLIAVGVPVMLVILAFGLYYFKRMEAQFADVV